MKSELSALLLATESHLAAIGRSLVLSRLQPGLDGEKVDSLLASIAWIGADSVKALYAWHDGTSVDGARTLDSIQLFPGYYFLPLEDAIANYKLFLPSERWSDDWLPIFANGGGDFYVIDGNAFIRHFRLEEIECPVEFESLSSMFGAIVEAFVCDAIYVDEHGYLELKDDEFARIAARNNPNVGWWV